MNNWFQYNKKSIITGGVGLILFLGVAGLGVNYYLSESEIHDKVVKAQKNISSLAGKKLPPTSQVLEELTQKTEVYANKMAEISKIYDQYRESSVLPHVDAQSFQNALKAESETWQKVCKEKNIQVTNEAKWMGFENYRASAPLSTASTMLSFQKAGIEHLLGIITNSGVSKFNRVFRPQLAIEKPQKAGGRGDEEPRNDVEQEWEYLPFEVVFTGDKNSVVSVINEITNSDKYLYVFSSLRIKNEKDKPVTFNVQKPDATPKSVNPGIALNLPDAAVAPAAEAVSEAPSGPVRPPNEEILQQVLGDEKIVVCLSLNLVHFKQPVSSAADASEEEEASDE